MSTGSVSGVEWFGKTKAAPGAKGARSGAWVRSGVEYRKEPKSAKIGPKMPKIDHFPPPPAATIRAVTLTQSSNRRNDNCACTRAVCDRFRPNAVDRQNSLKNRFRPWNRCTLRFVELLVGRTLGHSVRERCQIIVLFGTSNERGLGPSVSLLPAPDAVGARGVRRLLGRRDVVWAEPPGPGSGPRRSFAAHARLHSTLPKFCKRQGRVGPGQCQ